MGGLICFRKVSTCKKKDFSETFAAAEVQVAAPFVKDIVARFSAFYARQGQPDFDFDALLTDLTET